MVVLWIVHAKQMFNTNSIDWISDIPIFLLQARPASSGSGDPVVDKYVAMGLGREAVSFAVLNYGDNPAKACYFPPVVFFLIFISAPLIIEKVALW